MIEIIEKKNCCGCGACKAVCPTKAIKMQEDEQGFLYPTIDVEKCIGCNKCENTCPISNHLEETKFDQRAFLLQHKNRTILLESASGGAFSAIAETIIEMGGVVFGAEYDSKFNVVHGYVENKTDLSKFRNSKYVQSDIRDSYEKVREFLKQKRYVLFSGTPCQIEGLLNYIGKEMEYLFTVDVVCHAVPSPAVWKTYLSILNDKNIMNLRFRDKGRFGYLYSQFKIESLNNKYEGIETNIMLRAFFSEICNRPSCYECKFKKRYRRSDFTIWDCFDIEKFTKSKNFNQQDGISRMIIHSVKGNTILSNLKEKCIIEEKDVEKILSYDSKEIFESVEKNEKYYCFWKDFAKDNVSTLLNYFSPSFSIKVEEAMRKIAYMLGIYPWIRKTYKVLFGNRRR